MLSSHKIIKQKQAFAEEQKSFIQTKITAPPVIVEPEAVEDETQITAESKEAARARAQLAEAVEQKAALLTAAEQEAEEIKAAALEQGFNEGQTNGYQKGYAAGYDNGLQKAEEESSLMKENIQQMLVEAEAFVEHYYNEQKGALLDLAGHMAETIVHATIDASSEQVMDLIKPVIHRLKQKSQLITLSVRPEQSELVKTNVKELEKEHPEIRFAVLTDNTLDKNGCTIESAHAIMDLQVRKQLDAMLEQMKDME